ncbi:MAG: glutamine amidotransferase [Bifidobacterium crudilactis]|jgi:CobQ-like glutamine amidotransferase family enzyme|uniref:type 1 glutamine amidotransferase n=1 Tax=Bifidobacterium crudilactis TaxID=327277 RepID=UPI002354569D|nr:glutamine amidotransferase [Bifidobacterium crudilactis]MCI1218201.1 glutamine amidotransferase [Bifidobacterium crudilactis]MCI1636631.1 glutamine amidotransferase [Bifidobacterium crudilactis]
MDRRIDVLSLYPKDMNIYGDSGNVLSIRRRLELFGYHVQMHAYNQDDEWPEHVDLVLGGGGQDQGQRKIIRDLFKRADAIRALANDGVPMLMICGMYQLFGDYFETIDGDRLPGIGILGLHTIGQEERLIGNLVEHSEEFGDIVGYENHSGKTFLHEGTRPLGTVDNPGTGNNGSDGTEGARTNHVIGTYMHGSLLPKNPEITDFLIRAACQHRYGEFAAQSDASALRELKGLDDIASKARAVAMQRPR